MPKITSFVARSFHPEDESKINPILKILDTFHDLGFTWETAERAELESVSVKVRRRIEAADVFVGILTRRHPTYDLTKRWRAAVGILTGRLPVATWTPPPWVIQEAGYAQGVGRKLILFREQGVEIPGLQGDLEFIEFAAENYANALQRANEMILRVIAEQSGIFVETTVSTVAPASEKEEVASEEADVKEAAPSSGLEDAIPALFRALLDKKFDEAARVYNAVAERIKSEKPQQLVAWEALYHRSRFEAGDEHALNDLRALAEREPSSPLPRVRIAECLADFNEFVPAAKQYLEAADLSNRGSAAQRRMSAAQCFRKGKHLTQAKDILLDALTDGGGELKEIRGEALKELYEVFKESDEKYHALAIGELALYENPALNDFRFQLAFDYDEWAYYDMAIHHYALLCQKQPENAAASHNLGVAYSKAELNIRSAEAYRKAIGLGETLAAKNLAYRYVDGGMVDEASALVKKAMASATADPALPEVLSAIEERRKTESEKAKSLEESAERQRTFALSFSAALLASLSSNIEGTWSFPFAQMDIRVSGATITGIGETTEEIRHSLVSAVLGGSAPPSRETKKFSFSGLLSGRACRFRVETETIGRASYRSLLGSSEQTREGLIVFSETGDSAEVAELQGGTVGKYYSAKRA